MKLPLYEENCATYIVLYSDTKFSLKSVRVYNHVTTMELLVSIQKAKSDFVKAIMSGVKERVEQVR